MAMYGAQHVCGVLEPADVGSLGSLWGAWPSVSVLSVGLAPM
jgi:hypothetical protein